MTMPRKSTKMPMPRKNVMPVHDMDGEMMRGKMKKIMGKKSKKGKLISKFGRNQMKQSKQLDKNC